MKNLIKYGFVAFVICCLSSCKWEHNGKIVQDKDGNLFKLESSGYRNESYDLKPIDKEAIEVFTNNR